MRWEARRSFAKARRRIHPGVQYANYFDPPLHDSIIDPVAADRQAAIVEAYFAAVRPDLGMLAEAMQRRLDVMEIEIGLAGTPAIGRVEPDLDQVALGGRRPA